MKKLIVTILVFIPFYLSAQWEIIHQNKWEYFTSLDMVNDSLGFVTANDGQIIRTNDGGKTWKNHVKLDGELSELQFIDENHGWVIATDNQNEYRRLLRSVDGGWNWEEQDYNASNLSNIQFVTKNKGWAIKWDNPHTFEESNNVLVFTLDGGKIWNEYKYNDTLFQQIKTIKFLTENIGWLVKRDIHSKTIFNTTDGGKSWTINTFAFIPRAILPVSELNCYLEIDGGFMQTKDGGKNWIVIESNTESLGRGGIDIVDWEAINDSTIIFTNAQLHSLDNICWTNDGFKNIEILYWFETGGGMAFSSSGSFIEFIDSLNGYLLNKSYLINTTNKGHNWDFCIDADISAIRCKFLSKDDGLIVTSGEISNNILKTSNGGINWEVFSYPNYRGSNPYKSTRAISVCYPNKNTIYIGGYNSIIYTENGGNEWFESSLQLSSEGDQIQEIYFSNTQTGWALPRDGNYFYKSIDKGRNWVKVFSEGSYYC